MEITSSLRAGWAPGANKDREMKGKVFRSFVLIKLLFQSKVFAAGFLTANVFLLLKLTPK